MISSSDLLFYFNYKDVYQAISELHLQTTVYHMRQHWIDQMYTRGFLLSNVLRFTIVWMDLIWTAESKKDHAQASTEIMALTSILTFQMVNQNCVVYLARLPSLSEPIK